MNKSSLRKMSISCLAIWAVIWLLFLLVRFSSFDIKAIPGIGPVMLVLLGVAVLAPVAAIAFAVAALIRQSRTPLNWLVLVVAVAVFLGQGLLFSVTKWL